MPTCRQIDIPVAFRPAWDDVLSVSRKFHVLQH